MGQKLCTSIIAFSSHYSPSAEKVANNDDLVIEILLCLPIDSIIKFKYVSKHWYYLISSPYFSFRQNLIPQPISGLFLQYRFFSSTGPYYGFVNLNSNPSRTPFNSPTFVLDSPRVRVLQSCNGLFLCERVSWNKYRGDGQKIYNIYNPTTNQKNLLPPLPEHSSLFSSLSFDPSISPHYKVIITRKCDNSDQIQIYSSKTRLWKLCGATFTQPIGKTHGVFWNNSIHWIRSEDTSLYLDLAVEELREMPMPSTPAGVRKRNCIYFGESRGHLHLVECHGNYDPFYPIFDVHEMERDYSGWFVKYRFDLNSVRTTFTEWDRLPLVEFKMLCVVREKNEDDSYLVVHLSNKAIRCNFKDKTFKMLYDFARDSRWLAYGLYNAFQYTKSLACV